MTYSNSKLIQTMIATATKLFENYFKETCAGIDEVTSVRQSDGSSMERLLKASVNERIYPAVFVMRPKYKTADNGADQYAAYFEVVFYVFCQCDQGDDNSEDAAFDQAELVSLAILKKIKLDDQETDSVEFDYNTAVLEPVSMMTLDSTKGYEVKLQVGIIANEVFRTR